LKLSLIPKTSPYTDQMRQKAAIDHARMAVRIFVRQDQARGRQARHQG
jgi:hypothetical protein